MCIFFRGRSFDGTTYQIKVHFTNFKSDSKFNSVEKLQVKVHLNWIDWIELIELNWLKMLTSFNLHHSSHSQHFAIWTTLDIKIFSFFRRMESTCSWRIPFRNVLCYRLIISSCLVAFFIQMLVISIIFCQGINAVIVNPLLRIIVYVCISIHLWNCRHWISLALWSTLKTSTAVWVSA